MADSARQIEGTPCPKRTVSSPLIDENMKKHHGDDIDDESLTIIWEDLPAKNENAGDQTHQTPVKIPSTVEAKIDRMLELYMTLDDKIQRGNQISNERLTDLRNAHNNLVKKFVAQKSDIVERDIRISKLENDLVNAKEDLDYTRQDMEQVTLELAKTKLMVGDLIHTIGMVNTRVDNVEKTNLDQWTEIKEKKLIISGIPESKGENVKTTVVNKLKEVFKKSEENQRLVGYKGAKLMLILLNQPPLIVPID